MMQIYKTSKFKVSHFLQFAENGTHLQKMGQFLFMVFESKFGGSCASSFFERSVKR
jgi:hypothetical protein